MTAGIYAIYHAPTDTYYIGESSDIEARWKHHIDLTSGLFAQFNWTGFHFSILELEDDTELRKIKELEWITGFGRCCRLLNRQAKPSLPFGFVHGDADAAQFWRAFKAQNKAAKAKAKAEGGARKATRDRLKRMKALMETMFGDI